MLDLQGILWEDSPWIFLVMTVIFGGLAAMMAGKALARSWRPLPLLIFYMAIFGFAIRFLHWGLFQGSLLSVHFYIVDTLVLMLFAALSYRYARTNQMVTQYHWLYRRTSPFSWSDRKAT